MKTKNVPKGIKCKINTKIFLDKGFPKGGGGGGGGAGGWEKFPNNVVFFFESVPNCFVTELQQVQRRNGNFLVG